MRYKNVVTLNEILRNIEVKAIFLSLKNGQICRANKLKPSTSYILPSTKEP
jgi:hypothetical protein